MAPKASIVNAGQPSLDGWLSVSGPTSSTDNGSTGEDSPLLPSLRTHSPPLLDKDSIFLSSTFPLGSPPTASSLRTLINLHLSPPRAEGLPKVVERGEGVMPHHRMYAWRCLSLKKGRRLAADGGGEDDWEIKEGSDDDGEQYGGDRLLQVMREQGAVDCIVFCCRWFGGTLLGPIRFAHIQTTARHALQSHLQRADVLPLLVELQARDARIAQLRSILPPPPLHPPTQVAANGDPSSSSFSSSSSLAMRKHPSKAPDYTKVLDVPTAERLLTARGRTLSTLEKRVGELKDLRRAQAAASTAAGAGAGAVGTAAAAGGSAGREGLKRAVEAVLAEDDDRCEGEGEERRRLPAFKRRNVKEGEVDSTATATAAAVDDDDNDDHEVIELDGTTTTTASTPERPSAAAADSPKATSPPISARASAPAAAAAAAAAAPDVPPVDPAVLVPSS